MANNLGTLYAEIKLVKDQFSAGLKSAISDTNKFSSEIQAVGQSAAIAGAAVTAAFTKLTYDFIRYGSEVDRLNKITGISTDTIQKLGDAAEQNHSSMEGMATGLKFLSRNMEDAKSGSEELQKFFKLIGIDFSLTENKTLTLEQVLAKLVDTFSTMPDGSKKLQLALKLLGRSGSELIPVFSLGNAELKRYGEEFARTGKLLDPIAVKQAEALRQQFNELKESVQGATFGLVKELLPAIKIFTDKTIELVQHFKDLPDSFKQTIGIGAVLVGTFGSLSGVLLLLLPQIINTTKAIKTLWAAFEWKVIVGLAAELGSIGAAVATLAGSLGIAGIAAIALWNQLDKPSEKIEKLKTQLADTGEQINFVAKAIQLARDVVKDYSDVTEKSKITLDKFTDSWINQIYTADKIKTIISIVNSTITELGWRTDKNANQIDVLNNILDLCGQRLNTLDGNMTPVVVTASKLNNGLEDGSEKVKTLSEQFTDLTTALINNDAILKEAAKSAGIDLSKGLPTSREEIIKLSAAFDYLSKTTKDNIDTDKAFATISLTTFKNSVSDIIDLFKKSKLSVIATRLETEALKKSGLELSQIKLWTPEQFADFDSNLKKLMEFDSEYQKLSDITKKTVLEEIQSRQQILLLQKESLLTEQAITALKLTNIPKDVWNSEQISQFNKMLEQLKNADPEWQKLSNSTDDVKDSFSTIAPIVMNFGTALSDSLIDGGEGFKNFGKIAIDTLKKIMAQLIATLAVGALLKVLFPAKDIGSLGGFFSLLFDSPINDARLMLAGFHQGVQQQGIDMRRQYNDINRYSNMGSNPQQNNQIIPKIEVIIDSPPGAFVRSIKQVSQRDMQIVTEEIFDAASKKRTLL